MADTDVGATRRPLVSLRPTKSEELELEARPIMERDKPQAGSGVDAILAFPAARSAHVQSPPCDAAGRVSSSCRREESDAEARRSAPRPETSRDSKKSSSMFSLELELDAARASPEDAGASSEVDGLHRASLEHPPFPAGKRQLTAWSLLRSCISGLLSPRLLLQIGSVLQWCMFNIIMILVNNEIFQRFGFTFPLTLTTIHFIISYIGALVVIEVLRIRPKAEVDSGALVRWVLPMAAVTCFNVVLAQLSARYIPLHILLVTKALSPGLTVVIQAVAVGSEFDPFLCASLLPVMGGMVLAYAPDAHGQILSSELIMLVSALGSVVLGCGTVVCAEVLLQERSFNLDSINALYQMVPFSALILAPPALFFEGQDLLRWSQSLLDPLPAVLAILISGFFAFCLNFSLFYTIQKTSALTFNVAGNLKMAVSVVFAGLLFHAPMTQLTVAGCLVEVIGVGCYGWALFRIRKQKINMSRTDSERKRLKDQLKEEDVNIYLGAML